MATPSSRSLSTTINITIPAEPAEDEVKVNGDALKSEPVDDQLDHRQPAAALSPIVKEEPRPPSPKKLPTSPTRPVKPSPGKLGLPDNSGLIVGVNTINYDASSSLRNKAKSREERKMEMIMKAFEQMERAEQKKKEEAASGGGGAGGAATASQATVKQTAESTATSGGGARRPRTPLAAAEPTPT